MILFGDDYSDKSIEEQADILAKQRRRYLQLSAKKGTSTLMPHNLFDLQREGIDLPQKGDPITGYRFYQEDKQGFRKGGYGYVIGTGPVEPEEGYYYHNQEVSTAALGSRVWQWVFYDGPRFQDLDALRQYSIRGTFDRVPTDDGFIATDICTIGEPTAEFTRQDLATLQQYIKQHYDSEGNKND